MSVFSEDQWGVVLGGSSGLGLAAARRLARDGMSLFIVHRDRRAAMPAIQAAFEDLRRTGVRVVAVNADAVAARADLIRQVKAAAGSAGRVLLLLHAIAAGCLNAIAPRCNGDAPGEELLQDEDLLHTIHAMGVSLLSWVRDMHAVAIFAPDARVLGLTSEGAYVAWRGYAAIAAAKAAMAALVRSIAMEYGPYGIRANLIQAGVTDTRALRAIPGSEALKAIARRRNPLGRMTLPEDVANAVSLLCLPDAAWINGVILRVDGGEAISSL
jgi:enoyl-[acyl-carrier protein] reductase III